MARGPCHASSIALLVAGLLFAQPATAARDLSGEEIRGRALFLTGRSDGPPSYAVIGTGNVQVPAAAFPCASCHGRNGSGGRAEQGRVTPDITWPALSAPAAISGRQRSSYSDTSVIRAVTMGIDAGGNRLDPLMPRFHMSMVDAAALLAYLKRLGTLPEPGVADDTLVLGTVLGEHHDAAGFALSAYLARLNRDGGLFGRHIVLRIERLAPGQPPGHSVERLTTSEDVFALLAPTIDGDESVAVAAADADGVPMIGPVTPSPETAPRSRYVFYLDGGVQAEARALAGFAATLPGAAVIADDGTAVWHAAALAAAAALSVDGRSPEPLAPDDPRLFAGNGPVLWFAGRPPKPDNLRAAIQPMLLMPGTLAVDAPAPTAPARIWLAYTAGPPDIAAEAAAEYRALGLPRDDQPAQRQALAAAKVLVEALRRAGRAVTRERLVDAMESLQDFHTGLIPPVSYSATRRIGTAGVWIVPRDGGRPIWWDR